jgi:hypothetical protein
MRFTIGYIEHDPIVFDKYLRNSLFNLSGDYDIIKTSNKKCPAENYNTIIEKSKNRYVILSHQDISFSKNLLHRIEVSINNIKNFGVLGLVGVDDNRNYRWSNIDVSYKCQTLDCCFVVIDKENEVFFDSKTFDEYHLYVEDFCLQTTNKTKKYPHTLLITKDSKEESFLVHHSNTIKKLGGRWGNYNIYKEKLIKKWGDVNTT